MSDDADFAPIRGVRIPYVRRSTLVIGERAIDAVLCSLSAVGCYVTFLGRATKSIPQLGQTGRLSFALPGDPLPVECEATVLLRNVGPSRENLRLPSGCGLRFTNLGAGDHHRIGELVHDYRHSRQPRSSVPRPYSGLVRVPHVQPCRLIGDKETRHGVLCNVSLTGAYAVVDPLPALGERVRLAFEVSGEYPVEMPAEVVWVNTKEPQYAESLPSGCGLRFVALGRSDRSHLEYLVAEHEALPRKPL